jgi:hypothetical protein
MHCLENLYQVNIICFFRTKKKLFIYIKKISGHRLEYTTMVGKPSELTYYHAEYLISLHASEIGLKLPIKRLYAIGVSFSCLFNFSQSKSFSIRIIQILISMVLMYIIAIYKKDHYHD